MTTARLGRLDKVARRTFCRRIVSQIRMLFGESAPDAVSRMQATGAKMADCVMCLPPLIDVATWEANAAIVQDQVLAAYSTATTGTRPLRPRSVTSYPEISADGDVRGLIACGQVYGIRQGRNESPRDFRLRLISVHIQRTERVQGDT